MNLKIFKPLQSVISNRYRVYVASIVFILLTASCENIPPGTQDNPSDTKNSTKKAALMPERKTSGMISAQGANLYYEHVSQTESDRAIIFVHGSAGNSNLWQHQVQAFVNAGFQAITFDLRSAGRSIPEPGKIALGSIADDIEAIRKALKVDKLFVIGQALGAEGALEYSLKYPSTTSGIVVAATYRGAEAEPAFVELRDKLAPPSKFAGRSGLQMRLSAHYLENNPSGVQRFIEIDNQNIARQSVDEKIDAKRLKASVQSTRMPLDYAALSNISAPTLILSAERDDITPPELMSELAKQIPGAQYKTVPNAGRYAFWENPNEFNRIVLDFLKPLKKEKRANPE